jgi:arylsulfatase A-like enzyme
MVSVMDWYPTFLALAGGKPSPDHPLDGIDIGAFLKGQAPDPRNEIFYYGGARIQAVRQGSWKLRIGPPDTGTYDVQAFPPAAGRAGAPGGATTAAPRQRPAPVTELFNVDIDPGERTDLSTEHPDIVKRLKARMQEVGKSMAARAAPVIPFHESVSPLD